MAEKLTHVVGAGNIRTIELSDAVRRRARIGQMHNHDKWLTKRSARQFAILSAAALAIFAVASYFIHQDEQRVEAYQADQ